MLCAKSCALSSTTLNPQRRPQERPQGGSTDRSCARGGDRRQGRSGQWAHPTRRCCARVYTVLQIRNSSREIRTVDRPRADGSDRSRPPFARGGRVTTSRAVGRSGGWVETGGRGPTRRSCSSETVIGERPSAMGVPGFVLFFVSTDWMNVTCWAMNERVREWLVGAGGFPGYFFVPGCLVCFRFFKRQSNNFREWFDRGCSWLKKSWLFTMVPTEMSSSFIFRSQSLYSASQLWFALHFLNLSFITNTSFVLLSP